MKISLDLGTTSLAGRLLGASGECLAEKQIRNPQHIFGADVISRLEAARHGAGEKLQSALIGGIKALTSDLLSHIGAGPESIRQVAAAANPAISLLLQNLSPKSVLSPPYRPDSCAGICLPSEEYGFSFSAPPYLFPLVNGFVGGDLVAFLFGQEEPSAPTLYVDIGTNGEIALYADGRWWVTSVAAGPAFEGGEIGSGMLYGPGAIAGVNRESDRFIFDVVDTPTPQGICGSGLVEMIVAALEADLIDRHGSLVDPDRIDSNLSRYVVQGVTGLALELYRDADNRILLEQKDIRNFQLAKAAVRAGVECLLQRADIDPSAIEEVVLTGAFGFSLSKNALKKVAMLPENMVDKVSFEPGGVLTGIGRMLLLEDGPDRVEKLAARLKPYPLSGTPAFEKAFLSAIDF